MPSRGWRARGQRVLSYLRGGMAQRGIFLLLFWGVLAGYLVVHALIVLLWQ